MEKLVGLSGRKAWFDFGLICRGKGKTDPKKNQPQALRTRGRGTLRVF